MSEIVIKAEDIGKLYKLGEIGTGTISHDLNRWWARLRGKEDPFAKIGTTNDRTVKGDGDWVWALKDINFEVKQGEVLGIIGRNGAGKSTLLKILSKVTTPSTGRIKVKGRIASLLEVGTGFHPELTGRENIYLNGAILGMMKAEIRSKFDEIVEFSGVEKYIDTPVKRYSSGMYVRLAFAVAAHLESEILIVDEVLAVGDMEFQKKCIGKMQDVSKGEGRTVLFVSHNMGAMAQLCTTSLLLSNGSVHFAGDIKKGVEKYLKVSASHSGAKFENPTPKESDILKISCDNSKTRTNVYAFNEDIHIEISFKIEQLYLETAIIAFRVIDQIGRNIFSSEMEVSKLIHRGGSFYTARVTIPKETLVPNSYYPVFALHIPNQQVFSYIENKIEFIVEETGSNFHLYQGNDYGCVFIPCVWN
jgi:lipopolysaccharide transport system ATP-binding protein